VIPERWAIHLHESTFDTHVPIFARGGRIVVRVAATIGFSGLQPQNAFPRFAELANLASGMQTGQRDW